MASTAVIGAGAWGTALSLHLARLGRPVRLWVFEPELASLIQDRRENPWYLPGVRIPPEVSPTPSLEEAVAEASCLLLAVPSHVFGEVAARVLERAPEGAAVVSATKGLEEGSQRRMSEILETLTDGSRPVAVLSGPTFALEVARGLPTAAVLAARDRELAAGLQRSLSSPAFRLYTQTDLVGVELGGALKNVMAIAAGLSDGLELGANARAALLTRGLAELTRLGVALGARPATFAGLAGLGDLILTCTGQLSRNRRLGIELAQGKPLAEALGATRSVVEGVRTTAAALALGERHGVSLPITAEVGAVLFGGKPPREALMSLLARQVRPEEEPDEAGGPPLIATPIRGRGRRDHRA